jgi:hypothetical protein
MDNKLERFSSFTYIILDSPIDGEQFAQPDHRRTAGLNASRTRRFLGLGLESGNTVGVCAENATKWMPWFRTVAGLRGDAYRFKLNSDNPASSGTATESTVNPTLALIFGPWTKTECYVNAGGDFIAATRAAQPFELIQKRVRPLTA